MANYETSIKIHGKTMDLTELSPDRFVLVYRGMVALANARYEMGWGGDTVASAYYIALGDFFRRGLVAWSSDGRLVAVDY